MTDRHNHMDNMFLSRRTFTLGALACVGTTLAGCGNGIGSQGAAMIDARVDAALAEMYSSYPNTRGLADKANGMLIMPLVTDAGFGFGGSYGRGALRVGGITVDYYSATQISGGFQIGAQQYAHVLFFMTEGALSDFRSSPGWSAGGDIEYVFSDKGDGLSADTTTALAPVLAAVFGRAGLKAGATLQGTKYTRIIP
ncbi:YSC84-related protein [Sulfitobacter sp. LCG007]